jgi:hypothetical protein
VKKRRKSKPPVATPAAGHVEFIDKVFGGKLYPFRSYPPYRAKPETPGEMSAPPESTASSNPAAPPPVAPHD